MTQEREPSTIHGLRVHARSSEHNDERMPWLEAPPIESVFRRRENVDDTINERRLKRKVDVGEFVRIAPGSFAPRDSWSAAAPLARHAQRVWEAAARVQPGTVFSHFAAASIWDMDILGHWPDAVDVSVARARGGRSTGGIRRHTRAVERVDVIPWGAHFVTTPVQTAVDLAAAEPFLRGVVSADQALWARRRGGALVTPEQLLAAAAAYSGRGGARARRVAEFARPGADSVRESQSRVLIVRMGFPLPELQHRFVLPSGRVAYTDFWWPAAEHAGEFDGIGKYLDPELLRGRAPRQAVIEEKDREDELRRVVRALSRWRTPALDKPALLYDILISAGLRSRLPRPVH